MDSGEFDLSCGYMEDQNQNILKYPNNLKGICAMIALGTNPIAHPSVCLKRESLYLLYDESLNRAEDFDLWLRFFLSGKFRINVLEKPVTKYDISRSFQKDRQNALTQIKIRFKYIVRLSVFLMLITLGLIPNIVRLLFSNNILLLIRRRI